MSQPERVEKETVTVEDLLRLKRFERPAPEFWSQFERELRAKQLAAIVEKRPWWITVRLPQAARQLSRFQLPLGAAAVIAFSLIAAREYRPASSSLEQSLTSAPAAILSASSAPSVPSAASVASVASVYEPVAPATSIGDVAVSHGFGEKLAAAETLSVLSPDIPNAKPVERVPVEVKAPSASFAPESLTAMIPWAAPRSSSASNESRAPFTFGELPQVHFASVAFPGREHNFEGRVEIEPIVMTAPVVAKTAPMSSTPASAMSSRDLRRTRILSSLVVADNASETERSRLSQMREVLASALDDDRLYSGVRRLGMGGDRLTLKF